MLRTGLVSVTFRKLTPQEIIALVARAGLAGIEWGGDIHVPHGDTAKAREVRKMTLDRGIAVASYGSYYYVGETGGPPFQSVLDTAIALGAPTIRVWAGKKGSAQAPAEYRRAVVSDSGRIADMAGGMNLSVSYEFHPKTLTDTNDSAKKLLEEVARPNIRTYWQPPVGSPVEQCLEGLSAIAPWLTNLHVYNWSDEGEQLPLADGADAWRPCLDQIASLGGDRYLLIEFVKGDAPEAFLKDAAALKSWVGAMKCA